jgi:hypothetical protein
MTQAGYVGRCIAIAVYTLLIARGGNGGFIYG